MGTRKAESPKVTYCADGANTATCTLEVTSFGTGRRQTDRQMWLPFPGVMYIDSRDGHPVKVYR
jgi:hypothetical protein